MQSITSDGSKESQVEGGVGDIAQKGRNLPNSPHTNWAFSSSHCRSPTMVQGRTKTPLANCILFQQNSCVWWYYNYDLTSIRCDTTIRRPTLRP